MFSRIDPCYNPYQQTTSTSERVMNPKLESAQRAPRPATPNADNSRDRALQSSLEQVTLVETTADKPSSVDPQTEKSKTASSNGELNILTPSKDNAQRDQRALHNLRSRRETKQMPIAPEMSRAGKPTAMRALWAAAKQQNSAPKICPGKRRQSEPRGFACKAWVLLPLINDDAENDDFVNHDEYELCL
jgi:hypothetical protein